MTRKTATQKPQDSGLEKPVQKEPIAIIGIGCRFPGGANSPEQLWALLRDGTHVVSEIPSSRIDLETYFDPRPATPGKMMTRWGGFLEDIDRFDASFFGIAPREAARLDPQQRLLLEVAWEAIEDAGQLPDQLKSSLTGVYIGLWINDFESRLFVDPSLIDFYMTTGSGRYSASGRVSYFLGLQGPSITVDTACSSSLVAVHLACQSLWSGESSLAMAGGANVILQPHISIAYSRSKMMAADGRCKFGDAEADGYVRSEGAALVVLKRLSQAIQDGDSIYAVIRGGAVNNDGQSSGFLATPGQQGQEEMLRLAYRNAGVNPHDVQYVEAHGTGTRVGDPIELGAIGKILGAGRPAESPIRVGSIKTNFGHTEGAAGIAGLIKVALSLKNGAIPPSLHLNTLNPNIPWKELNINIPTALTPWPAGQEKIAGVSAFGIAGTNAHIVLAEAPQTPRETVSQNTAETYVLPLSAQSPAALRSLAESYVTFLNKENVPALQDIGYTISHHRTHHAERLTVAGKSHQELADQLSAYLQQASSANVPTDRSNIDEQAKVVFVFPGQGAQWLGMGRELLAQNPAFRESLTQCDKAIRKWADWSLLEQLMLDEDSPNYRLNEISVIQPTLFAMEVALAAVWRSWGIEPSAVIGHSMGEVAAAYVAGALSLEDAAHVICKRSQLMQRTSGMGAMVLIGLPLGESEELLKGYEDKLSIAVQNSPRSTVVSGDPDSLEALMENLRAQEIFCRHIKVDVASHSPQMDPIRPELVQALHGIKPRGATIPFYSTVTQDLCDGKSLDAEYWGRNLRQPVRFTGTIHRMLEDKHVIFIEMSPHPILLSSIEETCSAANTPSYRFASLRRDQPELKTILGELGSLYNAGYNVDWNKLYPHGEMVSLPAYPWQRERYWFETSAALKQTRPGAHPLLGQYMRSATGAHIWETTLNTKVFPYLSDHRVRGSVVFPAAAYVEMAFAAASEVYGSKPCLVTDFAFQEAFFLPAEEAQIIQLVMTSDTPDSAEFHFYSRAAQNDAADSWSLHASGKIEIGQETVSEETGSLKNLLSQQAETTGEEFYASVSMRGLEYGSNFQAIRSLAQQQHGILSKIKLPDELGAHMAKYRFHPVLIDACFQTLLFALPDSNQDTYLPTLLGKIRTHTPPNFGEEMWCYVIPNSEKDKTTGDILLFNTDGQLILSAQKLQLQRLKARDEHIQDFLYEVKWQESPIPYRDQPAAKHWLIFADQQGTGRALAEHLQKDSQTSTIVSAGDTYQSINENAYQVDPLQPVHFQQLLKDISQPIHGIIHLWSLDCEPMPSTADPNLPGILHLVQAVAQSAVEETPRLWLVTRGTHSVNGKPEPISVSQAPVWGMGAVIANEFPNLNCVRVDLSSTPMEEEMELLARTLQADDGEDQVALRNRRRYVARLKQVQSSAENETKNTVKQTIEENQPFQVQIMTPGILDHLSPKPVLRKPPKAGEVEIAVRATGLNFMNILGAMGICPGYPNGVGPLGIECAGIVTSVGEGVTHFQAGDEAVGIAFNSLGSHAVTDARLVVKKPGFMSFEEAASIPIAYLTAYYALYHLGRLQAGERVLIHSATGGVGLAAIQIAQRVGAEVFATAGSAEKREFLHAMGIQHVMDSRSLSFADDILKITRGEGVDIVLNSLAGSAITKGLEVLKPYGRFLEIGKRDIYGNSKVGLLPFQKNLSYSAIDLDKMSRERPDMVGKMLREVFQLLEMSEIKALPVQCFPVSRVSEGFRMMAQAKHIGKIVITMEDREASFELPTGAKPIRADGTYLITGGLGSLGLLFARSLAEQGARHLVLVGRSKPSDAAQTAIDELNAAGVNVIAAQADVADLNQLTEIYAQVKQVAPPLRGVIHAAGLLADGTVLTMDRERFLLAFAPKALGAWNLHVLTADEPLDFFIMFSSVAATLGTAGQVNYAAGNAFLDALARFRRSQNQPALSINWGPWSEIGLAATETIRGERLTQQGLRSISPSQGLDAMTLVMAQDRPQIGVMSLDVRKWCASQPAAARSSLFKEMLNQNAAETTEKKSHGKNVRAELLAVEAGRQRHLLFDTLLREYVAQVIHLPSVHVPSDKPLKTLGLDSLMSIELRNRLEDALGLSLSASLIWNYPTVNALVPFLAEKMGIPLDGQSQSPTENNREAEPSSSELDQLEKDELEALLAEELSAIDDSMKGSGFDTETRTR